MFNADEVLFLTPIPLHWLKACILTLQKLAPTKSLEKISVIAAFIVNLIDTYHCILRDPGLIDNTTTQYLVAASVIIVRKYYQQ